MWWQAAGWAAEYEARLAADRLDDMTFRLHCAAVAAGGDVDRAWKDAVAVYDAAAGRHMPWRPPTDRSAKPLRDLWVQTFGDPSTDAGVAAAVDRTVDALLGTAR